MEFKIFERLMIEVNKDAGNLVETTHRLSLVNYFRICGNDTEINGLKELWTIFLNCRGEPEMRMIARLLLRMYTNYKDEVNAEVKAKKMEELLSKIHASMESAQRTLNQRLIKNLLLLLHELICLIK
jgi:hypothetical protein